LRDRFANDGPDTIRLVFRIANAQNGIHNQDPAINRQGSGASMNISIRSRIAETLARAVTWNNVLDILTGRLRSTQLLAGAAELFQGMRDKVEADRMGAVGVGVLCAGNCSAAAFSFR